MACSKFEYVKQFEVQEKLLLDTFIVVRVDGKGFTEFCELHQFKKPNDIRALELMNVAAGEVMKLFPDIWISYGQSDEYSFVFRRKSRVYQRRSEKLISCVVSCFTAAYTKYFEKYFQSELNVLPVFDARCVVYPNKEILRDYLNWRMVDCHINNLYNTCFWTLVQQGKKSRKEAEEILKVTDSTGKNELLFNTFGINYNNEQEIFKKGSILIRGYQVKTKHIEQIAQQQQQTATQDQIIKENKSEQKLIDQQSKQINEKYFIDANGKKIKKEQVILTLHEDLINDQFWTNHSELMQYLIE